MRQTEVTVSKTNEHEWTEKRCPHCDALLFEKRLDIYALRSIRIKCRLCKEVMVL
ncbi:hypothetical protein [Guptibacillus sedimenti]|uniref:hypothetical protein n=1 Tax=Guptibacillus sedimenti TaxID=3025680 RepID=UPI00236147E0|nr:hypothetical protein [Pseudalkalibacillus sedimenti]